MDYSIMPRLSRCVVVAAYTERAANYLIAEILQGTPHKQPPLTPKCGTLCRGVVYRSTSVQHRIRVDGQPRPPAVPQERT